MAGCAGESACPPDVPFRCIDNTCVSDPSTCSRPIRSYQSEQIVLTISPFTSTTFSFLQDSANQVKYAELIFPSGAFLSVQEGDSITTTSDDIQLQSFFIYPVADSTIRDLNNPIDPSKISYVSQVFPLSNGNIPYNLAVRSPVVSLDFGDNEETVYRSPLILQIQADVANNSNALSDYCLGKANLQNQTWECSQYQIISYNNETFGYYVVSDGIYAVLFNPIPNINLSIIDDCSSWACQNKKDLTIFIIGGIVALVAGFYIICRIYRYIGKYSWQKVRLANMRAKLSELQETKTKQIGQSLRDKIEGITFTTNPLYENTMKQTKGNEYDKNLMI